MRRRAFAIGACCAAVSSLSVVRASSHAHALSGDRFELDGRRFRLADIKAPSVYGLSEGPEPFFADAREHLAGLLSSRNFYLDEIGPENRWGERPVLLYVEGLGATFQELLVAEGAARCAPESDNDALIDRLLALEKGAREKRAGLWRRKKFRVYSSDEAMAAIGGYHLVEGVVLRASASKARFYLNFGEDYRRDFTLSVQTRLSNHWLKQGFDLNGLAGKRVRARGTVISINGPAIDLVHRRQIELLD